MYIKNPNKKEPYTFRVNPELLEKIKLYAKATNTTVPELLSEMIEDKIDGYFLTDDYLTDKEVFIQNKGILGVPTLEEMYNNGKFKEFDLLDDTKTSYLVELERVPNNLDIWDDKEGYKSFKRGIDHEGIDFVLIPDLILSVKDFENEDLLKCCLVPIYFRVMNKKDKVTITNISFEKAISMIRESQKIELLDKATSNELAITETIHTFTSKVKNAIQKGEFYYTDGIVHKNREEMVGYYKTELVSSLLELAVDINANIIPQQYGMFERAKGIQYDNIELGNDNILTELMEENQTLQNRVNELEAKFDKLNEILELGENPEYRKQIWDELKTEK